MEVLSLKKYAWKCVLGSEVLYAICLAGGFLPIRSSRAALLHHTFFETLPGFTWLTPGSIVLGVLYAALFAWIFAWYYVWMHNSSLIKS